MFFFETSSTSSCRSLLLLLFVVLLTTVFSALRYLSTERIHIRQFAKDSNVSVIEEPALQYTSQPNRNGVKDIKNTEPANINTTKHHSLPPNQLQGASSINKSIETSYVQKKKRNKTESLHASKASNSSCNMPQPPSYPVQPPEDDELHEQILDYVAFHKKARACLQNPSCKRKPKILVVTCPKDKGCLGLGDRMRGLVFSFTIALITKRVYFLHDFSQPYPLQSGLIPYAVDWTLPPTVQFNHSWPYLEWYWCKKGRTCNFAAPLPTEFRNFNDVTPEINMFTDDIVKLFGDKPFIHLACRIHFQYLHILRKNPHLNDTYAGLSRFLIRKQMSVHRLLFQPSEASRQMMKAVEFQDDYISVHIRTGVDSKEVSNERFSYIATHQEAAVDRIIECMERVGEGAGIKNVFLASDSSLMKELFIKKVREKGFDVHLFGKQALHYEKVWTFGSVTWDALCEGFMTIFSDLFMLARAKVMVINGSNFASFAHNLGRNQSIVEINPESDSPEEKCQPLR